MGCFTLSLPHALVRDDDERAMTFVHKYYASELRFILWSQSNPSTAAAGPVYLFWLLHQPLFLLNSVPESSTHPLLRSSIAHSMLLFSFRDNSLTLKLLFSESHS